MADWKGVVKDALGRDVLTVDVVGSALTLATAGGKPFLTFNGTTGLTLASGVVLSGGGVLTPAEHVADGSTVDQLRDALVTAGLMAAAP